MAICPDQSTEKALSTLTKYSDLEEDEYTADIQSGEISPDEDAVSSEDGEIVIDYQVQNTDVTDAFLMDLDLSLDLPDEEGILVTITGTLESGETFEVVVGTDFLFERNWIIMYM